MRKSWIKRVVSFYIEGFREMTVGRTLWLLIAIKLIIMFGILKIFFFPDFLNDKSSTKEKEEYISGELIERSNSDCGF